MQVEFLRYTKHKTREQGISKQTPATKVNNRELTRYSNNTRLFEKRKDVKSKEWRETLATLNRRIETCTARIQIWHNKTSIKSFKNTKKKFKKIMKNKI